MTEQPICRTCSHPALPGRSLCLPCLSERYRQGAQAHAQREREQRGVLAEVVPPERALELIGRIGR
jgi:hypothetical protein